MHSETVGLPTSAYRARAPTTITTGTCRPTSIQIRRPRTKGSKSSLIVSTRSTPAGSVWIRIERDAFLVFPIHLTNKSNYGKGGKDPRASRNGRAIRAILAIRANRTSEPFQRAFVSGSRSFVKF